MSDYYMVRTRGAGAFIRGNYTFTPDWQKVAAEDVRDFDELEIVAEEEYKRKHAKKAEKAKEETNP